MSFYCLFTTYFPGSVLGTRHASEQDGHGLCGHGSSREKIETASKLKINKAITNCDKCYEEHKRARKITLQKDVYNNILAKN